MRIGVELRCIVEGECGGVVPLLQGVLETLVADWPQHQVTLFCTTGNSKVFASLGERARILEFPHEPFVPLLDVYVAQLQLDVVFSGFPSADKLRFPAARRVVLIPDLQHEAFPEFFTTEMLDARRRDFAWALGNAGAIATISEHARTALRAHPATRCEDIFLAPPALRLEGRPGSDAALTPDERALVPDGPFFIYPANIWPHKNHRRVLQAFANFRDRTRLCFELILTGHPQGWPELAKEFPGLPVRHLSFVRRAFLEALVARARGLLFFSLYEGFGMPLLEAFHAGVPVACSNAGSLPEVGADAVACCDPLDAAAMSSLMERINADEELRQRLIARGQVRLHHYRWRASAAELVAACDRVVARSPAPMHNPLESLSSLLAVIQKIEADRAARLEVIRCLDEAVRVSKEEVERLPPRLLNGILRAGLRFVNRRSVPVR